MVKFAQRFYTHSGSPTRGVFRLSFSLETGAEELICVGKENFQQIIEASRDACDIGQVIARVRAGDTSALHQVDGFYGDITGVPLSIHELIETRRSAEAMFASLPKDRREAFGSFEEFCSSAGTVSWLKALGYDLPEEKVESEVKDNASS